jgi:hypothetical protein
MFASRSTGRRAVVVAVIAGALFCGGFASAGDRSASASRRVDAELLLNLDLLSDERFADDRRGDVAEPSARSLGEFDLPGWDDHGEDHAEPRK